MAEQRSYRFVDLVTAAFVAVLIISNIASTKILLLGPFTFDGGTVLFPLAYIFGDGFSNLAYPTNPVLLITLGLASVSYAKWIKFTWKLWLLVLPVTVFFLWLGNLIHLGPF